MSDWSGQTSDVTQYRLDDATGRLVPSAQATPAADIPTITVRPQPQARTQPTAQTDPIWPTSNPVGTERFVDYRGWDQPTPQAAPADITRTHAALAADPNVGNILPVGRDPNTGSYYPAVPNVLRETAQGAYDLSQGPRLGGVTPQASTALMTMAAPDLAATPTADTLRTFGGITSRTADLSALTRAAHMELRGKDPYEIWDATGWFRGANDIWKYEIPDQTMSVKRGLNPGIDYPLRTAVRHPQLYSAYPEMRDYEFTMGVPGVSGSSTAQFTPPFETSISVRGQTPLTFTQPGRLTVADPDVASLGYVAHELQHGIQYLEKWPYGGSPSHVWHEPELQPYLEAEHQKLLNAYIGSGGNAVAVAPGTALYNQFRNNAAASIYRRLAGEVEARTAESRQYLSPRTRRLTPPWEDYDIPLDQQIIRSYRP